MPVYSNTVADNDIKLALGSPTLIAGDIVNIVEGTTSYDTNLAGLGTTQFGTFLAGPGFSGNLGDFPNALLVNAVNINLLSSSPLTAIKGTGAGTITSLVWKNGVAGTAQISEYAAITRADLLAPGIVNFLASASVTNAYVNSGGLSVTFDLGSAAIITRLDVGVPSSQSGTARAVVGRDATTINIDSRGEVETIDDCSPTTVNLNGGSLKHRGGAITNINVSSNGGVIDFSKLLATLALAITWVIDGDFDLIEPPAGITVDLPTSAQIGNHRVTYHKAA